MGNREIKFRALKDDLPCHFVYGHFIRNAEGAPRIQEDSAKFLFTTCLPGTEGQYTGMKTKDGKDIYEGDIVVADRYPFFNDGVPGYVGVIEWAHAAWYYGLECVNDKLAGSAVGDQLGADGKEVTEFRIIGNIHEHPHLLSGGN